MKASLTEEDIILHTDSAESYRSNQQDARQSMYFGNQSFSIFAAYCYTKPFGSDDFHNDSVAVVTESSDHDRLVSVTSQQWVLDKTEEQHEKIYNNIFVWSGSMSPESETMVEPDDVNAAPKIKETLSIHKLVRRRNQKGEYNITFFKVANEEDPFYV